MLAVVNRRRRLRERFGPEYDRAVTEHDSKRQAEAELAERERRVRQLNIRPLEPAARAKYSSEWTAVQEQFVDAPQAAVTGAQTLIVAVMKDRGYPTEGHDQTVADLSVEQASTMDRYRAAHAISERAAAGSASTEDLRQAMVDYRSLFAELLGERPPPPPPPPAPAWPAVTQRTRPGLMTPRPPARPHPQPGGPRASRPPGLATPRAPRWPVTCPPGRTRPARRHRRDRGPSGRRAADRPPAGEVTLMTSQRDEMTGRGAAADSARPSPGTGAPAAPGGWRPG